MAAIDWTFVAALESGMSAVPAAPVDVRAAILEYANGYFDPTIFDGGEAGIQLKLARAYLAIHRGWNALPGASAVAGAVIAESGGGLSVQYGKPDGYEVNDLKTSQAGRTVLSMAGNSLARVWVPLGDVQVTCGDGGSDWWV